MGPTNLNELIQLAVVVSAVVGTHWHMKSRVEMLEAKVDRLEALILSLAGVGRGDRKPDGGLTITAQHTLDAGLLGKSLGALACLALLLSVSGCTNLSSDVTDGTRHTVIHASTFLDGKSALEKFAAKQGTGKEAQAIGVGSLSQESATTTNFNALVEGVVGAAIKATIKP